MLRMGAPAGKTEVDKSSKSPTNIHRTSAELSTRGIVPRHGVNLTITLNAPLLTPVIDA